MDFEYPQYLFVRLWEIPVSIKGKKHRSTISKFSKTELKSELKIFILNNEKMSRIYYRVKTKK